MTPDRLAYLSELIDRAIFRMRSIGMTDEEIIATFRNAAQAHEDNRKLLASMQ